MTVFVVIGGWNHEGFDEPAGVFSAKEDADKYAAKVEASKSYAYVDVLEYDIDHLKD